VTENFIVIVRSFLIWGLKLSGRVLTTVSSPTIQLQEWAEILT